MEVVVGMGSMYDESYLINEFYSDRGALDLLSRD